MGDFLSAVVKDLESEKCVLNADQNHIGCRETTTSRDAFLNSAMHEQCESCSSSYDRIMQIK
jgi:hypothetical protein